jgi:hypothetical protein
MRHPLIFCAAAGLLFTACGANTGPATRVVEQDEDPDTEGPVIDHVHDPSPRTFGEDIFLDAVITDDSEIDDVRIVFQRETDGQAWTTLRMAPRTETFYDGAIPGDEVTSGGLRYYLEAVDEFDNSTCLPEACAEEAWHFPIVPPRG